jgi:hypothetical protein
MEDLKNLANLSKTFFSRGVAETRTGAEELTGWWQLRLAVVRTDHEGVFGHGRTRPGRAGRNVEEISKIFDVMVR